MSAILYGIGVGPGAEDLLTLRAVRLIENSPHIVYITARKGQSMARSIAARHIGIKNPHAQEHEFLMPMNCDPSAAQQLYTEIAALIATKLEAGEPVAFLCEGDPLFFGSFLYIHQRLKNAYPVQIVPGVASPMAAAASLAVELSSRNQVFSVVPATLPEAELRAHIGHADSLAIMKVGRHLPKVRALLEEAGCGDSAHYIEYASTARERRFPLAQAPDNAPYFSIILLNKGGAA